MGIRSILDYLCVGLVLTFLYMWGFTTVRLIKIRWLGEKPNEEKPLDCIIKERSTIVDATYLLLGLLPISFAMMLYFSDFRNNAWFPITQYSAKNEGNIRAYWIVIAVINLLLFSNNLVTVLRKMNKMTKEDYLQAKKDLLWLVLIFLGMVLIALIPWS